MAKVVIDLERLKFLECGLGQFSFHLGRAVAEQSAGRIEPVFLVPDVGHAQFHANTTQTISASAWRKEWISSLLRPFAKLWPERFDLWHVTHQDSRYWPVDRRVPVILTIHDLNFLREKPPNVIRRRMRKLQRRVDRASVLTAASEFAATEIRQHLRLGQKEIRIIPHGICLQRDVVPNMPQGITGRAPYLFTIGDVTPKKNFHVLVDLLLHLPDLHLVIAGSNKNAYATAIEARATELGVQQRVLLTGRVSEAERIWLYQHCEAFAFPSLSEGFGLPVIEAMNFGRPVFCSRRTSLPEVGGDLAFYWDSFEATAMASVFRNGMSVVSSDPGFSDKLKNWSARFDWKLAGKCYVELYEEVLGKLAQRPLAA